MNDTQIDTMIDALKGPITCPICHRKTCTYIPVCQDCNVKIQWNKELLSQNINPDDVEFECPEFNSCSTSIVNCGCLTVDILKSYIINIMCTYNSERDNLHSQVYYLRKLLERNQKHFQNLLTKYKQILDILNTYKKVSRNNEPK